MPLSQKINTLLLDLPSLPSGENTTTEDLVIDAQDFVVHKIIQECTQFIKTPEDLETIDQIMDGNPTIDQISDFFASHSPDYNQKIDLILQQLKEYMLQNPTEE